jgi:CrcB protein
VDLTKALVIGAGGFLGANARYWLGGLIQSRAGATFPWGTFAINLLGSLAIGIFMEIAMREGWHPNWRLFVAVGVLGGFTTFSSFAYESVGLLSDKSYGAGSFYVFGSAILCVTGAWVGRILARLALGG